MRASQDPGKVSYNDIGGLNEQIRELREVIELPLTNPEVLCWRSFDMLCSRSPLSWRLHRTFLHGYMSQLFVRVGIKPPKGVLLYGPPGDTIRALARIVFFFSDSICLSSHKMHPI